MDDLFLALTFLFATAAIVLFMVHRLSLPVYPAYIVTGIIAGYVIDVDAFLDLAYLGVIFLVFFVGLHTRTEHLSRELPSITLISVIQIGVIAGTTVLAARFMGIGGQNAVLIAMAASLSSTLVDQDIVEKELQRNLLHGRIAEGFNILQDIAAILLLILFLEYPFTAGTVYEAGVALGIIVAAFIARPLIPRILNTVTRKRPELLMISGLAALLATVAGFAHYGVSSIIGAYAVGVMFSEPVRNADLRDALDPLRDFFVAFMFLFVGALLTVPGADTLVVAGVLILCSMVFVPVIVFLFLLWTGHDSRTAYLTASRLDQVSEFAVIAAILGFVAEVIPVYLFQGILLAFAVTLVTSALTARYADRIHETLFAEHGVHESSRTMERSHVVDDLENHIIVAGYGNTGKALVEHLSSEDTPLSIVAVDYDPGANRVASEDGISHVFGDLLHAATWGRVNADRARLIVSTTPNPQVNRLIHDLDTDATKIVITDQDSTQDDAVITVSRAQLSEHTLRDILRTYLGAELTDSADPTTAEQRE